MKTSSPGRSQSVVLCLSLAVFSFGSAGLQNAVAQDATEAAAAQKHVQYDFRRHEQVVAKAIDYLKTKGQAADGSFSAYGGPGLTALVATALLESGQSPNDPAVRKALAYLESFIQPSGGIYAPESTHRNYETCTAVLAFTAANRNGRYDDVIKKADAFIKGIQWNAEEGKDVSDPGYGGAGYGSHKRPDLSNTSFLIEALKAAGNDANSEAIQQALLFVSRCQNLETEHNNTPFAAKNPDGGFYYTPAAGGSSQAGDTPNGGLRSYGSMTYAGLKSMIYAGVGPKDPRVKAATNWIRKHYDLSSNPGMGENGLYYYYHTFSKALEAVGQDEFIGSDGVQHDWRSELLTELARRQQTDGSWFNETSRWLEGDRNLVTAYALLSLAHALPHEGSK